jgi:hypothetical protein
MIELIPLLPCSRMIIYWRFFRNAVFDQSRIAVGYGEIKYFSFRVHSEQIVLPHVHRRYSGLLPFVICRMCVDHLLFIPLPCDIAYH